MNTILKIGDVLWKIGVVLGFLAFVSGGIAAFAAIVLQLAHCGTP